MVDSQCMGIPIWVVGLRLAGKYHEVSVRSRVDGIILSPHIIGGVMHLHGLDGVYGVIRDDD